MCCYTHQKPVLAVYGGQLATRESLRCRCGIGGVRCVRQATQEDRLCDRCRADEPGPPVDLSASPAAFEGPDWYAAGRVGYIGPERLQWMADSYRLDLTVAKPGQMFIISGLG